MSLFFYLMAGAGIIGWIIEALAGVAIVVLLASIFIGNRLSEKLELSPKDPLNDVPSEM